MKILICEDEELTRMAIAFDLKEQGYEIITAEDGFEAMSKMEKEKPDLVISDIAMPYLSGFELLNYMKNKVDNSKPVILVSGLNEKEIISTAIKLGADAFITKPIHKGEVSAKVQEVLSSRL
jgi:DNA-binding response OmpR family regulator